MPAPTLRPDRRRARRRPRPSCTRTRGRPRLRRPRWRRNCEPRTSRPRGQRRRAHRRLRRRATALPSSTASPTSFPGGQHDDAAAAHALADVVVASPTTSSSTPAARKAPKLWPARALEARTHTAGRQARAESRERSRTPRRAPTARSQFPIAYRRLDDALIRRARAAASAASRSPSSPPLRVGPLLSSKGTAATVAAGRRGRETRCDARSTLVAGGDRHGRRPRRSVRRPRPARCRRTSSATWSRYVSTSSGVAANFARSSGRCVAIPTGQVSRWQDRTIRQPSAISTAVPNDTSSAPSSAATITSRPVFMPPSARSRDPPAEAARHERALGLGEAELPRRAACLIEESGLAPVPPSAPAMWMTSASAFATPAATRPTPADADELDRDGRGRVPLPEIEDELGEILDRVDVVVRRRRDQLDAGLRVPSRAISSVTLWPGSCPPSPGFEPCAILICSSSAIREVLRA